MSLPGFALADKLFFVQRRKSVQFTNQTNKLEFRRTYGFPLYTLVRHTRRSKMRFRSSRHDTVVKMCFIPWCCRGATTKGHLFMVTRRNTTTVVTIMIFMVFFVTVITAVVFRIFAPVSVRSSQTRRTTAATRVFFVTALSLQVLGGQTSRSSWTNKCGQLFGSHFSRRRNVHSWFFLLLFGVVARTRVLLRFRLLLVTWGVLHLNIRLVDC